MHQVLSDFTHYDNKQSKVMYESFTDRIVFKNDDNMYMKESKMLFEGKQWHPTFTLAFRSFLFIYTIWVYFTNINT